MCVCVCVCVFNPSLFCSLTCFFSFIIRQVRAQLCGLLAVLAARFLPALQRARADRERIKRTRPNASTRPANTGGGTSGIGNTGGGIASGGNIGGGGVGKGIPRGGSTVALPSRPPVISRAVSTGDVLARSRREQCQQDPSQSERGGGGTSHCASQCASPLVTSQPGAPLMYSQHASQGVSAEECARRVGLTTASIAAAASAANTSAAGATGAAGAAAAAASAAGCCVAGGVVGGAGTSADSSLDPTAFKNRTADTAVDATLEPLGCALASQIYVGIALLARYNDLRIQIGKHYWLGRRIQ